MNMFAPRIVTLIMLLLAAAGPAASLSCVKRAPLCAAPPDQTLRNYAIFIGTAAAVTHREEAPGRRWIHYEFQVLEQFAGPPMTEVTLAAPDAAYTSYTKFRNGVTYLAEVTRPEPGKPWVSSGCLYAQTLDESHPYVHALRAWKRGQRPSPSILGAVLATAYTPALKQSQGFRLRAKSAAHTFFTTASPEGTFRFMNLPGGIYHVSVLNPGWELVGSATFDLTSVGCAEEILWVQETPPKGYLSIRIETTQSPPPRWIEFILDPPVPGSVSRTASRQFDGSFAMDALPPGAYFIAYETAGGWRYWPGVADRRRAKRIPLWKSRTIRLSTEN